MGVWLGWALFVFRLPLSMRCRLLCVLASKELFGDLRGQIGAVAQIIRRCCWDLLRDCWCGNQKIRQPENGLSCFSFAMQAAFGHL